MSEFLSGGQGADHEDLHALRERCGELETALRSNVDAARMAELQRELAACRQRVLEVEQQQAREQDGRPEPEAREGLPEDVQSAANAVQAAAPVIEAAAPAIELGDDGRQAFERAEVEQPRQEQDAEHTQSSGGSRERERLNPDIARFSELVEAHRTGAFSLIYDRSLDFGTGYRGSEWPSICPNMSRVWWTSRPGTMPASWSETKPSRATWPSMSNTTRARRM
ncbi:hypothetical protein LGM68_22965 (plasmid) [Xanthomonas citri pv. malvacearum]|uniref:hypothetical protein n=1 Tax=Xanthomonas citri TaxID=346 RepID=UPI0022AF5D29|nr:hypothetical protein [Xanthomonas citri]WAW97674.1 hypothetical protein LGM68_22965 [Xanthomonas citri pv. malvacearum]